NTGHPAQAGLEMGNACQVPACARPRAWSHPRSIRAYIGCTVPCAGPRRLGRGLVVDSVDANDRARTQAWHRGQFDPARVSASAPADTALPADPPAADTLRIGPRAGSPARVAGP